MEEAAGQRGQGPGQVIRSILFRVDKNDFFLTLIAGPGQISWRRLRARLGVSRISMASETDVLKITGYEIGTVNPLGLPNPIPILVDVGVFHYPEISMGCGVPGTAIIMASADLRKVLGKIDIGLFAE